ncbi:hypothetical protein TGVAND_286020 [Toxoplasma gondii VAND]|uniref:Uncharacterized protein n=1 Tax=Toxoplasma gondii VAND TaxID=933077 RepID=A0A086Q6Z7_TOXGO|nr:hypothetical protein TGVAND_286020 [Toxoplasma gondii VAND]
MGCVSSAAAVRGSPGEAGKAGSIQATSSGVGSSASCGAPAVQSGCTRFSPQNSLSTHIRTTPSQERLASGGHPQAELKLTDPPSPQRGSLPTPASPGEAEKKPEDAAIDSPWRRSEVKQNAAPEQTARGGLDSETLSESPDHSLKKSQSCDPRDARIQVRLANRLKRGLSVEVPLRFASDVRFDKELSVEGAAALSIFSRKRSDSVMQWVRSADDEDEDEVEQQESENAA